MGTLRHVVIVEAPLERVWERFTDIERLASTFRFIQTITPTDEGEFVIEYKGKLRRRTLHLAVTERVREKLIAWKVTEGGIGAAGSTAFDLSGSQTHVTFVLSFDPPGGRVGDVLSNWFQYPHDEIATSLAALTTELEQERS